MGRDEREISLQERKGETDFYVIIDYKKMRGVRCVSMEDGNGDVDRCLVIPMLKNGIKDWGKDKWRVILAARKSHRDENASHVLVPQVEDGVQRGMVKTGYFGRYEYTAPIVGDVVPDITKIPKPPTFSKNSLSYIAMDENRTDNPSGGLVAFDPTAERGMPGNDRNHLTEAQIRMRELILKRKKGCADD